MKLALWVVPSTKLQAVLVFWTTSVHVVPPLLLTWIFSPAESAPLVPETVTVVSLGDEPPAIDVIANVSAGTEVSTVAVTAAVVVVLPAASVALAVKLWLPSGSAAVVKLQPPSPSSVAVPSRVTPSNT